MGNEVVGFVYRNNKYFFQKNLQGDIVRIFDEINTLISEYEYDAWGNHTIKLDKNSIGTINPFRYLGYYYDSETNLYYCQERYYNPELCRWMSLDDIGYVEPSKINGFNLYAYCGNNPVMYFQRCKLNTTKYRKSTNNIPILIANNRKNFNESKRNSLNLNNRVKSLSFANGLYISNSDSASWLEVSAFYARGSFGWGYTIGEGYSLASISFGVLDATFHTPKWFSNWLPENSLANPNIFFGVGTWNANASIGAGISGTAEIISGTIGIRFGDSISIGAKGYLGIGFTVDFTNGIRLGGGIGFCYEISINIDWSKIFN